MSRLTQWIATLPTTNILFLVGVVLIIATACVTFWNLLHSIPMISGYDAWLLFVGGIVGIERAGFVGKRATAFKPPSTESGTNTGEPIIPESMGDAKAGAEIPGTQPGTLKSAADLGAVDDPKFGDAP